MSHDDVPCRFPGRSNAKVYDTHDFFYGDQCRRCGTKLDPPDEPYDPYCKRKASEMDDLLTYAEDGGYSRPEWVRAEEGTYNERTNHFACDECYIRLGMPVAIPRWVCP